MMKKKVHWDSWMDEIPGLVMDNEVFDDAKEKVCWDSWMNGIPDLVWSIKFLMMEKKYFWDSWMNEIHGLIWTMKSFDENEERVSWNRMNE